MYNRKISPCYKLTFVYKMKYNKNHSNAITRYDTKMGKNIQETGRITIHIVPSD